jgi:AraC-like DNA-binding protein
MPFHNPRDKAVPGVYCPGLRQFQGFPVYKWSTDQVHPKDRFDFWREVRARGLFGVTAELEAEQRPHFFGEFSLQKFDGAGLIELRASPYRVERSSADIADAPGGSSQAVTTERMKQSRLLLEAPARPVSEIALACGFESRATFYRAFHAAHGMPPGDFTAQACRETEPPGRSAI